MTVITRLAILRHTVILNPKMKIAFWAVIALVALVAASCGDQSGGGMWQGGGDSTPSWR